MHTGSAGSNRDLFLMARFDIGLRGQRIFNAKAKIMATWNGWEKSILGWIEYPQSQDNVDFLDQWQRYEGGTAAYNPLNTTWKMPGSTDYNSAGVQNYVSAAQGAEATARTLKDGYYPHVLAALQSGSPCEYTDRAGLVNDITTWGTTGFADRLQSGSCP